MPSQSVAGAYGRRVRTYGPWNIPCSVSSKKSRSAFAAAESASEKLVVRYSEIPSSMCRAPSTGSRFAMEGLL